jgi:DNA polymerase III subunit epsilon
MKLQLTRPLCFLDIETTGLQITTDRIVQIGAVKILPNGETLTLKQLINPQMKISEESISIHGINDEDVKNAPIFEEFCQELIDFLGDADLAGYNSNKFDIPLLAEEIERAGNTFDFHARNFVDVQNIFHKKEQRTLSAAIKFYCNEEIDGAHDALADSISTMKVFMAQLEKYDDLSNDVASLATFSRAGNYEWADLAGRLAKNDKGEVIYNFGKHKGKTIKQVDKDEPGYYGWFISDITDFPRYTKQVLKREMDKIKQEKKEPISENHLDALKAKFSKK